MPLKVAAKIDQGDYAYYRSIRPLLRDPQVEFLGEINEAQKSELLAGSYALLFPVAQPEPFGLALIEALACGTPVVAWREGAVPELIDQGVTGFVVNSVEGAVGALSRVWQLDRRLVARVAHQRYSARRMARDYLRLYARSIARDLSLPSVLSALPAFTPPDYAASAE
jgi:glycosyltransferase involved in cell wall biosynthesis